MAKLMGEGLSHDERMSVDAPHYLFPYSVVARLWAAAAACGRYGHDERGLAACRIRTGAAEIAVRCQGALAGAAA